MNKKFYDLSIEKQNRIKQAGYKTFGENTYKKASMQYLADEAGISKALIFHYFRNKMTLYQWLFDEALKELNVMDSLDLSAGRDFFEMIYEVIMSRLEMMEHYQVIYGFVTRVFNDSTSDGHEEIQKKIVKLVVTRKEKVLAITDMNRFKEPSEVSLLYDLINDLANGFYQRVMQVGSEEKETVAQFLNYLDSIKRHYYKEEFL